MTLVNLASHTYLECIDKFLLYMFFEIHAFDLF